MGRYLESDPIGLEGGVNTYVYAESSPLNDIDFFGLLKSGRNKNTGDPNNKTVCQVSCFIDPTTTIVTTAISLAITKGLGSSVSGHLSRHATKSGGRIFDGFNVPRCLDECDETYPECTR